ncbi:MAG: hypothetical protein ABI837_21380 [Acidobacteriota bacterium]
MRHQSVRLFILAAMAAAVLGIPHAATAGSTSGYELTILMDDNPRREYFQEGTRYVEAVRGAGYSIRLTNPTPYRVAVALSVDGLNTIDAKHSDARSASKWVLGPYESTVIDGWQVSNRAARGFFFTGERHSYGAALGQTDNLGVIEAVYFRERQPEVSTWQPPWREQQSNEPRADAQGMSAQRHAPTAAAPPPAQEKGKDSLSDDYAATGMGHRRRHEVEKVEIELERQPAASVRIRYEFHAQLVKLGVLPESTSHLDRRERSRGFETYCPEPK